MRLTIDEYSKHFKMSKEMINSKLRAKKINYIIENSTTYIIVTKNSVDEDTHSEIHSEMKKEEAVKIQAETKIPVSKTKTTVAMILSLYQKENQQLKDKIVQLESKIDKLIDDKEQMLRDEMAKIEQVYSAKDEQLKAILKLMSTKLITEKSNEETIHEVETLQEVPKVKKKKKNKLIEFKEYLKTMDLEAYQKKVIKRRFLVVGNSDVRVIKQEGKLFLDFDKYDYSDLLEF